MALQTRFEAIQWVQKLREGQREDKSSLAHRRFPNLRDRRFLRKFDGVHFFETNLLFRRRDVEEFHPLRKLLLAQKNRCAISRPSRRSFAFDDRFDLVFDRDAHCVTGAWGLFCDAFPRLANFSPSAGCEHEKEISYTTEKVVATHLVSDLIRFENHRKDMRQNFLVLLVALLLLPLVAQASDFNGDGKTDIVWQHRTTGERRIWLMNGTAYTSSVSLGFVPEPWNIVASGDFNGDGDPDLLWENSSTGQHAFWLMDGTALTRGVSLGTVPPQWKMVGAADFNADGKTDLLWQNTTTGQRAVWLMNGTVNTGSKILGTVSTDWEIVGVADFNDDANTDILWQNRFTGERLTWLMNGTARTANFSLGFMDPSWEIAGASDLNRDNKPDIVWQNLYTGQRAIWIMDGTTHVSSVYLPPAPPTAGRN